MSIQDVKRAYEAQMDLMRRQAHTLYQASKGAGEKTPGLRFDRLELSDRPAEGQDPYSAARGAIAQFLEREAADQNARSAEGRDGDQLRELEELLKILEIYRRISSGGEVPAEDERRLMEYSHELYLAAKTLASMKKEPGEKYASVYREEERRREEAVPPPPPEIAPAAEPEDETAQ